MSSLTGSSAIHRVGEFTHSLRLDAVPADVRRQAALSLLDTIGCMVAGSATSDAGALLAAEGADAEGRSTVVGHARRLSPRAAARCNGYLGDIFELNDLTGGHASIATVAAAMTAAEVADASGRALLEAVTAGIEATTRIYNAVYPTLQEPRQKRHVADLGRERNRRGRRRRPAAAAGRVTSPGGAGHSGRPRRGGARARRWRGPRAR